MKEEKNISPGGYTYTFSGLENLETSQKLKEGHICKVTGIGNSMTPILKSRQPVICVPVTEDTSLEKKNIVLCKVNGHFYLHLIWAIKKNGTDDQYLIGNNHGHANGWVHRKNIFGKVVEIL
jgi:hypothetical protein